MTSEDTSIKPKLSHDEFNALYNRGRQRSSGAALEAALLAIPVGGDATYLELPRGVKVESFRSSAAGMAKKLGLRVQTLAEPEHRNGIYVRVLSKVGDTEASDDGSEGSEEPSSAPI